MPAPLFKDLGKKSKDLLTKDIPTAQPELSVTYKGVDDVEIEFNGQRSDDNKLTGKLAPTYEHGDTKVELGTTSDRQVSGTVTLKNQVDGLTVAVGYEGADDKVTFDVDYRDTAFSVKTGYNRVITSGKSNLSGALVFELTKGFNVGAEAVYDIDGGFALSRCGGVASYDYDNDVNFTFYGNHASATASKAAGTNFGVKILNRRDDDLSLAVDATIDQALTSPNAKIGGAYKYDKDTNLKAIFNTKDRSLTVSTKYVVTENLTVTGAASAESRDIPNTLGYGALIELSFD